MELRLIAMIEHAFFEQFDKLPPAQCTCGNKIPLSIIAVQQYYTRGQTKAMKAELKEAMLNDTPEVIASDDNPEDKIEMRACCVETIWSHKRLF